LSRESGGEVGVNVWVVSVGAKGSVTSGQIHTVTVTMVPQTVDTDGTVRDVLVGDAVKDLPPLPQAR
jgi:Trypsin-co-occurring domain 2